MKAGSIINLFLVIWNTVVFVVYFADKIKAVHKKWRIPERSLLMLAFCFGGLGAFMGMILARHKINKKKFMILVPLFIIIQTTILVLLIKYVPEDFWYL
ncbi:MAG: DUF1294 domain-containing protein [Eubacterium sp.]|nr:DUF1294 domain-containing protein [Eubacterium sp.]